MNNKFDELAKGLAQSVTRRGALKKFGVGLAGIALASLVQANKAEAAPRCATSADCARGELCWGAHCTQPTLSKCKKCSYPYGCVAGDTACVAACDNFCSSFPGKRGFWQTPVGAWRAKEIRASASAV